MTQICEIDVMTQIRDGWMSNQTIDGRTCWYSLGTKYAFVIDERPDGKVFTRSYGQENRGTGPYESFDAALAAVRLMS